jgi:hypothetical protein
MSVTSGGRVVLDHAVPPLAALGFHRASQQGAAPGDGAATGWDAPAFHQRGHHAGCDRRAEVLPAAHGISFSLSLSLSPSPYLPLVSPPLSLSLSFFLSFLLSLAIASFQTFLDTLKVLELTQKQTSVFIPYAARVPAFAKESPASKFAAVCPHVQYLHIELAASEEWINALGLAFGMRLRGLKCEGGWGSRADLALLLESCSQLLYLCIMDSVILDNAVLRAISQMKVVELLCINWEIHPSDGPLPARVFLDALPSCIKQVGFGNDVNALLTDANLARLCRRAPNLEVYLLIDCFLSPPLIYEMLIFFRFWISVTWNSSRRRCSKREDHWIRSYT